jgi:toxin ParE1/3/4
MGDGQGAGAWEGEGIKLPVVLTPEAQADYDDSYEWYLQNRPGFETTFEKRVQEVFDRISKQPLMHGRVLGDVRRGRVFKLPYIVLYLPEPTRITVISIFHTSRDPKIWQSRV